MSAKTTEYLPSADEEEKPAADFPPPPALKPWLFSQLVRDHRLTAGAFRLWHLLHDMSRSSGRCWPGERHLSGLLRCSERSLPVWRRALIACGYLAVETITARNKPPECSGRKHGGFIYTVKRPDPPSRSPAKFQPAAPSGTPVQPAAIKRTLPGGAQCRTKLICTKTPPYSPQTGSTGKLASVPAGPTPGGKVEPRPAGTAANDGKQRNTETKKTASMKTTRHNGKRELLRLSRRNSESIRSLLQDPGSFDDGKVSIPERLTPAAVARLTELEKLATQFAKDLRR